MTMRIGFDRRVKMEWLDSVAWKAATGADIAEIREYLGNMLESEYPNREARRKTITVLTGIWVRVPEKHRQLQEQALRFLSGEGPDTRLWLHWGMTILAYPFFRDIGDIIGRLLTLQDEVSLEQISRRLAERWGERSTVRRASQRVVRSMVDWGVLQDTSTQGVYKPCGKKDPPGSGMQLWFLETVMCSQDAQSLLMQQVSSLPIAFPFRLDISAATIRRCKRFEVQRQGLDVDMVTVSSR